MLTKWAAETWNLNVIPGFNGFYNNVLDVWLTIFFTLEAMLKARNASLPSLQSLEPEVSKNMVYKTPWSHMYFPKNFQFRKPFSNQPPNHQLTTNLKGKNLG